MVSATGYTVDFHHISVKSDNFYTLFALLQTKPFLKRVYSSLAIRG